MSSENSGKQSNLSSVRAIVSVSQSNLCKWKKPNWRNWKPEQQSCSKYSGNFWYFTSFFSPQRGIEIKRRVYTSCFTHFRTDSSVAALSELNSSMARFQKWQSKNTNKVEYTQNMKHFPNAFDNPIIPVTATKVNVTKKLLACDMCEKA